MALRAAAEGARVVVAAAVLFAFNALRGVRLKPSRTELGILTATGLLLWVGGNGAVNWAEQRIDSGLAALIALIGVLVFALTLIGT